MMKLKHTIDDTALDKEIKKAFTHQLQYIAMKEDQKRELLKLQASYKPPSALQAFLEREICIPVVTLPALALSLVLLVSVSFKVLLAPEKLSEVNYKATEIQYNHSIYISDRR